MADPRDLYRPDTTQQYRPDRQLGLQPSATAPAQVFVPGLAPAPQQGVTEQATKALAGLVPDLEQIFAKREKEQSEADLLAGREAALREAMEYGEAVRQGKLPANQSKWFMKGYKAQYGENLGQQWAMEAKVAWEASEAKNSDDPKAVRDFLTKFTQDKLKEAPAQDADIRAGMLPNLAKAHTTLIAAQTEYSANKVREQHLENVGVAIAQDLDQFAAGRMSREQFLASLESRDKAGILMGVNKDDMTKSIVAAVTNKARASNNMGILKVLDDYKFVGKNPKYAAAIRAAEDGIISRSASLDSMAWTRQQRQRQEQERVGTIALYDAMFESYKAGKEPDMKALEPIIKATGSPDAYVKAFAFVKTINDSSQEMSVDRINRLTQDIISSGTNALATLDYMVAMKDIKNKAVYDNLRAMALTARDLTNDRTYVDFTNRILSYGGQGEFGRPLTDPFAAQKAANEFRYRYAQWVNQNPGADPQARDQYASRISEQLQKGLDQYKMGTNPNSSTDTEFQQLKGVPDDQITQRLLEIRAKRSQPNQQKKQ